MMNQMRDNSNLLKMPRLSIDSPKENPTGPSGPDFINLGNINGSDDPESIMPLTRSPEGVMTQP
jgi:hypothetical protein